MMEYTHGGDLYPLKESYEGDILDCSTNLNPLGIPPQVVAAAQSACSLVGYPDPHCRELRQSIAVVDGVPPEQILCGNGAADLIIRLVQGIQPRLGLITAPTFSEYGEALSRQGCQVVEHFLKPEEGFDLTTKILEDITPDLDICFLCTPNNPTGRCIPPELMSDIIEKCSKQQVYLVVDECFLELSTGGLGLVPYLQNNPHLFLLRAFTKSYAMAGLRLGYLLCSDRDLLDKVAGCGQPWSVSTVAQHGGVAVSHCPQWTAQARELLAVERPLLAAGLQNLGFTVFTGEANYLLFQGKLGLKEALLSHGILIRSCANYSGLDGSYYRVKVGQAKENLRLLKALKEVLV